MSFPTPAEVRLNGLSKGDERAGFLQQSVNVPVHSGPTAAALLQQRADSVRTAHTLEEAEWLPVGSSQWNVKMPVTRN